MRRHLRQVTIVLGIAVAMIVGGGLTASAATASTTTLSGLRITGWTTHTVGLQWNAPAGGAAGWTFWVRTSTSYTPESKIVVVGNTVSANVPDIVPGVHQLRIVALDGANRPAESDRTVTVNTNALFTDTVAPGAPRNVHAGVGGATTANLGWDFAFDNTGKLTPYQVSDDGGTTWKKASRQLFGFSGGGATFLGLRPGTQHRLAVRAVDGAGLVSAAASVTVTTPPAADVTPPSAPSDLRVVRSTSGKAVALTWSPSTDDSGSIGSYRLFEADDPDLILAVAQLARRSGSTTRIEVADLVDAFVVVPGKATTVNLRAFDATGNLSTPSNSVTFTA